MKLKFNATDGDTSRYTTLLRPVIWISFSNYTLEQDIKDLSKYFQIDKSLAN